MLSGHAWPEGLIMRIEESASHKILNLCKSYGIDKDETYARAQLVISVYHEIVWGTVKKEYAGTGALEKGYKSAVEYLNGFPAAESKSGFQVKLLNLFQPGWLSELIMEAVGGISSYARNGNEYADILIKRFFSEQSVLDKELYPLLRMTKSTYFRMRKEAIAFLGVRLWGVVLPERIRRLAIPGVAKKATMLLVGEAKGSPDKSGQNADGINV